MRAKPVAAASANPDQGREIGQSSSTLESLGFGVPALRSRRLLDAWNRIAPRRGRCSYGWGANRLHCGACASTRRSSTKNVRSAAGAVAGRRALRVMTGWVRRQSDALDRPQVTEIDRAAALTTLASRHDKLSTALQYFVARGLRFHQSTGVARYRRYIDLISVRHRHRSSKGEWPGKR